MNERDDTHLMRGPFVNTRWRCPSCQRWRREPIWKRCAECRATNGDVVFMARDLEGRQFYVDLSAVDKSEDQLELMLDMVFAIEKTLQDREDIAIETDDNERVLNRLKSALDSVSDLYETLNDLKPEDS